MTDKLTLSPRLSAAADLVRQNALVADVGTDHAYLPIALCLDGKVRGGVVSDINQGPITRARENITKYGLDDRLCAVRTNGLSGIDIYHPEDIMILGMGGELIATIIGDAPWTKAHDIHLVLQPMTHPEHLRAHLSANGYAITDERIVREEDKIYQIILSCYTGKSYTLSEEELLLGKVNIERGGDSLCALADHYISTLSRKVNGMESAGVSATAERTLIDKIHKAKHKGESI